MIVPIPSVAPSLSRCPWMAPAFRSIGVDATTQYGFAKVATFLGSVDAEILTDETITDWCSAFVYECMHKANVQAHATAHARSWLHWGVPILCPEFGCVAVRWRGKTNDGHSGHVGFYLSSDAELDYLLGGNQHSMVSIVGLPKRQRLGFRMPSLGIMTTLTPSS
jgi:uncharacterized protein (TIGR02594 family)